MDSEPSNSPDAGLVTSGIVEKMKNRRKQKFPNQPKKVKQFKNSKKLKKLKNDLKSSKDLVDQLVDDEKLTNKLSDKLKNKLTTKLANKLASSSTDNPNEKEINLKELVAASLLLKSLKNQSSLKNKCSLLTNLLTNKQIKLNTKDKLSENKKFISPNSLTINHQPLIAMFGQQNQADKLEETISLNLKEDLNNCLNDKSAKLNCKFDDHNCLNSNETHQIVISLLERLIDQQQNATNQLMQLNKTKLRRRKRLIKLKDADPQKMVIYFIS